MPPLRPGSAAAEDRPARERLRFDLTRLDVLLLVEQWLALIHSPRVAHLPPQVRRLRYENGVVDYRHRHHFLSLWAENAQRLGWLQPLTFLSRHSSSCRPMRQAHNRCCIAERERQRLVGQSYISLAALSAATTRLGSGDVFALFSFVSALDVTHTAICERRGAVLAAMHAAPGCGVIRSGNFVRSVSGVQDVIGVALFRA